MTISKDDLAAYADGELTGQARLEVQSALEADPKLRVELDRLMTLKRQLSDRFDPILDETVPERLIAAAMDTPARTASVADLSAYRFPKAPALTSFWPQAAAMAASVAFGLVMGGLFLSDSSQTGLIDFSGEYPVAHGALAAALTEQLGSETGPDAIAVPISFQDESGVYCRAFSARRNNLAGIACRSEGDWQVRMTVDTVHADTPYRTAASPLPLPVLEQLDRWMAGEAFDLDAESAALARGWSDN
ncbi:anti-sigma factor family protein [Hyphobacterium marinum]|uniref:Anti-sigma factor n=1 Tax=Hyphobacterium marinum TaxID=3116574 RepID=A0ABU7LXX2_9PROT|nr:hypothetical protein [Hyphobacterium sp. Y6023]MEE2566414.1 hypothetical protein [Hyphobacterium sp. Y6023]